MTVSAVHFGATPATSFTVNSATQVTAVVPAGTGTVNVRVTTPGGQSAVSANFTYSAALQAPIITSSNAANATEGTLFSYTITASGNPAPVIATGFNATGLPAWLTRTNNVVSGTPPAGSAPGPVTFTVTATNSQGTSPGVLVTVAIAAALAGWQVTHAFTVRPTFNATTGSVPLTNWVVWNSAYDAIMNDVVLYDTPTSQADEKVKMYATYPSQPEVLLEFDNFYARDSRYK